MSGLESLPPDQRAVLQLILVQGRGYADLATTLRLDPSAVRERAHAGAAALAGNGVDADTRGRVVDYLLGQQDDGERIVTYAALGEAPAAARWAQALRDQLTAIAPEQLPEVPAAAPVPAAVNGSAATVSMPEPPAVAPDPVAPPAAPAAPEPVAAAPVVPTEPAAPVVPAEPAPPAAPPREPAAPGDRGDASAPRPSRLGGAILIAGALALAIVLAVVLIGGDGDDEGPASTGAAQTQAARTATGTQPSGTGTTATRSQARPIGVASLRPAADGSGLAAALVQQYRGGRRLIAVQADRMPGNSGQDFYAIWLQGTAGNRFLGFVPNQVRAGSGFLVSSDVTNVDLSTYATVLVTSENGGQGASTPTTPGPTVLSGPLRLAG
ncbi:MAG TPA: sigma-70 region 4 domain-containing protein [Conexibacter sp.]|nr:sigma-70 region 4 domain-containing protein [Conexibacter sp.]